MSDYWLPKTISIRKLDESILAFNVPPELGQLKHKPPEIVNDEQRFIDWIQKNYSLKVEFAGVQDGKIFFAEVK